MTGSHAEIDVSFAELQQPRETSSKVIELSRKLPESFGKASGKLPETTAALSESLGISEQSLRSWMRRFGEVCPSSLLSPARGLWSDLAAEMAFDFAEYRNQGWNLDRWLDERSGIYVPPESAIAEAFVDDVRQRGAIVPVETRAAGDAVSRSLALASTTAASAEMLLDQVFGTLDSARAERLEQQSQARLKRILAEETLAIAQEEQLREQIRAGILARRQAAADAQLQQQLEELRGGSDD